MANTGILQAFMMGPSPFPQYPGNTMDSSIVVQRPEHTPKQLILFFHGVGSNAKDLAPVAQQFAKALPNAMVVSVDGPQPSDFGAGRQWFSVAGVTEDNRPARVEVAMPVFQTTVQKWQAMAGVSAEKTILVGFSQGAIMSLESTQRQVVLAGQVISFAGRFAKQPKVAHAGTTINFIHGEADPVIAASYSRAGASQLQALGAKVTVDTVPAMGHGIDGQMLAIALAKLVFQTS
jgi:phospholipase/carboxylesterase